MPHRRLEALIDEARDVQGIRAVVFTGGECFLLGRRLDALVARANSAGFVTRCVSNAYWADTPRRASDRIRRLVDAGLREINLSTGTNHSRFVPVRSVLNAAEAAAEAGLVTLINIEAFDEADVDTSAILASPTIRKMIDNHKLAVRTSVWIGAGGTGRVTHKATQSRFAKGNQTACSTILSVLAVTPDQRLSSCCGLLMNHIAPLSLGSVAQDTLTSVIARAPNDLLKLWLRVEGPERILEFASRYLPGYRLPVTVTHPCQTCLHLFRDNKVLEVLADRCHGVEDRVIALYVAGLAAAEVSRATDLPTVLTGED